ncbi:hypothetical protein GGX14DRAFT_385725 [Mycena pura]|uniref:Uncharacterized protein n=1 Tax=Mycena pura TaxID=153505 RepID=A0AAD6YR34_9AGAR|nr:hypothetical protein GGX14DRAFT_385725 [Mycena pura]
MHRPRSSILQSISLSSPAALGCDPISTRMRSKSKSGPLKRKERRAPPMHRPTRTYGGSPVTVDGSGNRPPDAVSTSEACLRNLSGKEEPERAEKPPVRAVRCEDPAINGTLAGGRRETSVQ